MGVWMVTRVCMVRFVREGGEEGRRSVVGGWGGGTWGDVVVREMAHGRENIDIMVSIWGAESSGRAVGARVSRGGR